MNCKNCQSTCIKKGFNGAKQKYYCKSCAMYQQKQYIYHLCTKQDEEVVKKLTSFVTIGKNMYKNGTICMLACGLGRVDDETGNNQILGNIATWSGKATFGAKVFINQGALAIGIPQNHLCWDEPLGAFTTMFQNHGQYAVAIPILNNPNYRYAILNTSTIAISVHGPKFIEPSSSLNKIGRSIDSAFKNSKEMKVKDKEYQKFESSIKLFK